MTTLISGATRVDNIDLNGKTVASVRSEFGDALNIPTGPAYVNGDPVEEGYTVRENDVLSFAKPLGEKGL